MNWKHLPIVAFDTETTGLSPFGGDRIVEVAVVVLHLGPDGRVAETEERSWLVNPGIAIPRSSSDITGIYDRDVADKPPFVDIAGELWELMSHAITVAHNYPFDMAFLTQEFLRAGRPWPEPLAEVDTVDLSMRVYPDVKGHKLADVCERLSISLIGAHRATNDALACGRCFLEMARRDDVPDDLQAVLDWSNAIGRPPDEGFLVEGPHGRVVFGAGEGELAGKPAAEHPIRLAWMEKARVREPAGWSWRYPEATRRWLRRWLDVRGSGRIRPSPKSPHPTDWGVDSCIALDRRSA